MWRNSAVLWMLFSIVNSFISSPMKGQQAFIHYKENRIVLPTDSQSWFQLARQVKRAREKEQTSLNMLHIGDSHIQGDYFTGEVREVLFHYLNAHSPSRGLAFPYRLVKTNGPDCFSSHTDKKVLPSSIRKTPGQYYTLSGYKCYLVDSFMTLRFKDTARYAFNCLYVFHSPLEGAQILVNGLQSSGDEKLGDSLIATRFDLGMDVHSAEIGIWQASCKGNMQLYGVYYLNTHNPVLYNAVGVNGATYQTFLQMKGNAEMLKFLHPDCVILSYGTNESIDRTMDTTILKSRIRQTILLIRSVLPQVPIILTTPGDHLVKRKYLNHRIEVASSVIRRTAHENNCASWDFYQIMGGPGSIKTWYHNHLVFVDWIHLSKKGYKLQGDLFSEALLNLFQELTQKAG